MKSCAKLSGHPDVKLRLKLITKDVYIYGCSFGTKFMFLLYSEKNFKIQRNIFLFRETFSYSEEILLYSEKHFHIQRKFFIQWISLYCKKLSYSKKFYYVQWIFCYIKINFSYSEKKLYLKKLFRFRENFYIQRKCLNSEKMCIFRENHEFKYQIAWDTVVGFW